MCCIWSQLYQVVQKGYSPGPDPLLRLPCHPRNIEGRGKSVRCVHRSSKWGSPAAWQDNLLDFYGNGTRNLVLCVYSMTFRSSYVPNLCKYSHNVIRVLITREKNISALCLWSAKLLLSSSLLQMVNSRMNTISANNCKYWLSKTSLPFKMKSVSPPVVIFLHCYNKHNKNCIYVVYSVSIQFSLHSPSTTLIKQHILATY